MSGTQGTSLGSQPRAGALPGCLLPSSKEHPKGHSSTCPEQASVLTTHQARTPAQGASLNLGRPQALPAPTWDLQGPRSVLQHSAQQVFPKCLLFKDFTFSSRFRFTAKSRGRYGERPQPLLHTCGLPLVKLPPDSAFGAVSERALARHRHPGARAGQAHSGGCTCCERGRMPEDAYPSVSPLSSLSLFFLKLYLPASNSSQAPSSCQENPQALQDHARDCTSPVSALALKS